MSINFHNNHSKSQSHRLYFVLSFFVAEGLATFGDRENVDTFQQLILEQKALAPFLVNENNISKQLYPLHGPTTKTHPFLDKGAFQRCDSAPNVTPAT